MPDIYIPVCLTLFLFLAFLVGKKFNLLNMKENPHEIFMYSVAVSTSILLSISLMIYALESKIILGLTEDLIHNGIFIGGFGIFIYTLADLASKVKKREKSLDKQKMDFPHESGLRRDF